MDKTLIRTPWFQLGYGTLDGNHHGKDHEPLRRTWRWVRMGAYVKMWTLYIYRSDARAHAIRFTFPKLRGPWPKNAGSEPL